jgi:hypothetical protein
VSTHTPGPWTVAERDDGGDGLILRDSDGEYISYLTDSRYVDERDDPEAIANARLIAKAPLAPKLAEALRDIVQAEWTMVSLQAMTPQHRARLESARAALAEWDAQQ